MLQKEEKKWLVWSRGWGGGDICEFSRASQICSLLFCTCFAAEQYPLFIKKFFISHLPLSSHLSHLRKKKKKKNSQEGSVCSGAAIVFSRMDRCTNTPPVCLRSGRKTKQKGLRLPYSAHADGGRRQRGPANEETRGKSCLRRVYSSVNLQGRTDIL